ncbi:hypothetical protein HK405_010099 [Cladochytrium tenue]|nr:hypothetical protein HK405_010099 [Cladochytrium tenue]
MLAAQNPHLFLDNMLGTWSPAPQFASAAAAAAAAARAVAASPAITGNMSWLTAMSPVPPMYATGPFNPALGARSASSSQFTGFAKPFQPAFASPAPSPLLKPSPRGGATPSTRSDLVVLPSGAILDPTKVMNWVFDDNPDALLGDRNATAAAASATAVAISTGGGGSSLQLTPPDLSLGHLPSSMPTSQLSLEGLDAISSGHVQPPSFESAAAAAAAAAAAGAISAMEPSAADHLQQMLNIPMDLSLAGMAASAAADELSFLSSTFDSNFFSAATAGLTDPSPFIGSQPHKTTSLAAAQQAQVQAQFAYPGLPSRPGHALPPFMAPSPMMPPFLPSLLPSPSVGHSGYPMPLTQLEGFGAPDHFMMHTGMPMPLVPQPPVPPQGSGGQTSVSMFALDKDGHNASSAQPNSTRAPGADRSQKQTIPPLSSVLEKSKRAAESPLDGSPAKRPKDASTISIPVPLEESHSSSATETGDEATSPAGAAAGSAALSTQSSGASTAEQAAAEAALGTSKLLRPILPLGTYSGALVDHYEGAQAPDTDHADNDEGMATDLVAIATDEKPYPCTHPGCAKSFATLAKLKIHGKSHRNQRKHECLVCHQFFLRRQDLERHSMRHAPVKQFTCDRCGTAFTRKDARQRHLKSSTGCGGAGSGGGGSATDTAGSGGERAKRDTPGAVSDADADEQATVGSYPTESDPALAAPAASDNADSPVHTSPPLPPAAAPHAAYTTVFPLRAAAAGDYNAADDTAGDFTAVRLPAPPPPPSDGGAAYATSSAPLPSPVTSGLPFVPLYPSPSQQRPFPPPSPSTGQYHPAAAYRAHADAMARAAAAAAAAAYPGYPPPPPFQMPPPPQSPQAAAGAMPPHLIYPPPPLPAAYPPYPAPPSYAHPAYAAYAAYAAAAA